MAEVPAVNAEYNKTVPFLAKLPQPLKVGSNIYVTGTMVDGDNGRFVVNLQSGSSTDPRDDTALHLSVRPKEHTIVRNIYTAGWDSEERSKHCPISVGRKYFLTIAIKPNAFSIFVQSTHFCDFKHRIPFKIVSFISIEGETTIESVRLDQIELTPFIEELPALNPPVPFITKLSKRLKVGDNIQIIGFMTKGRNGRFTVNLQCGDDVALHLSVRPDERTIVRNTYRSKWEVEERSTYCPISADQSYHFTITIKENCFAILVNKIHYCDFKYRFPFERISFIKIDGNTILEYIDIYDHIAKDKKNTTIALHLTEHNVPNLSNGMEKLKINEQVKYFTKFPYPLHAESKIRIAGIYNENDRFSVSILYKPDKKVNTELLLVILPKEFTVIRSFHLDGPNPEKSRGSWMVPSGQKYTILIHLKRNNFLIYVNDELCCNLYFRLPFITASHLAIKGETILNFAEVNDMRLTQETKFLKFLPHPLRVGAKIHINGSVNRGGDGKFVVNLLSSNMEETALHLGIYPGYTIIRSIHNQNGWSFDESDNDGCPISIGEDYDVVIEMNDDSFKIILNGNHYCDYRYRYPLETVRYVNVEGETSLKFVRLHSVFELLK